MSLSLTDSLSHLECSKSHGESKKIAPATEQHGLKANMTTTTK